MKILHQHPVMLTSFALCVFLGNSSPAATYYVDATSGSDASPGTDAALMPPPQIIV